eukprot:jgi/Picre1/35389/NNA_002851.t1
MMLLEEERALSIEQRMGRPSPRKSTRRLCGGNNLEREIILEGSEIPWGRGLQQSHGGRAEGLHESTRAAASRWDDPMAHILGTKQRPDIKTDTSLLDRFAKDLKKAGFNVPLDVPKHSWLNRNMGPPVNRFGIRPGRHWDGVDRSNGFEKDLFRRKAELRQREQMAHYMAQEDM